MKEIKDNILSEIANAIVQMDVEKVKTQTKEALTLGITPEEVILNGLSKGMEKVSELFREYIYYIPEIVVCGDTMYAGFEILKPHMKKESGLAGKIVIGVVEGDYHDIGKNIVAMMLEGAGFEVYDLGSNVFAEQFLNKASEVNADIIAMSCLMSTTRESLKTVIDDMHNKGWRKRPLAIIGGAAISSSFAERIGADGYAADACDAVSLAKSLMSAREQGGSVKCG